MRSGQLPGSSCRTVVLVSVRSMAGAMECQARSMPPPNVGRDRLHRRALAVEVAGRRGSARLAAGEVEPTLDRRTG